MSHGQAVAAGIRTTAPPVRRGVVPEVVAVVGAGIGGLAAACALQMAGARVTVFERTKTPADQGSGVVLAPNGMKAMARLGVARGVIERGHATGLLGQEPQTTPFLKAKGGVLSKFVAHGLEEMWGAPMVSILRAQLRDALLERARELGVEVVMGHGVVGLRQLGAGVEVDVETLGTVRADLLVGADGLRSRVRRVLLDDGPPQYLGYTAVRGVGPTPGHLPGGAIAYGRGASLFVSPLSERESYWVASMKSPQADWPKRRPEKAHRDLLVRLAGWEPGLVGMIESSEASSILVTDVFGRSPTDAWHRGNVVLIGDAAHPMSYMLGQGANTAMEDAVELAAHLRSGDQLEASLQAFVGVRHQRVAPIVKQSEFLGRLGHVSSGVPMLARNAMMRMMGWLMDPDRANREVFGWAAPQIEDDEG